MICQTKAVFDARYTGEPVDWGNIPASAGAELLRRASALCCSCECPLSRRIDCVPAVLLGRPRLSGWRVPALYWIETKVFVLTDLLYGFFMSNLSTNLFHICLDRLSSGP